jgi:hypothetical protein
MNVLLVICQKMSGKYFYTYSYLKELNICEYFSKERRKLAKLTPRATGYITQLISLCMFVIFVRYRIVGLDPVFQNTKQSFAEKNIFVSESKAFLRRIHRAQDKFKFSCRNLLFGDFSQFYSRILMRT